MTRKSIPDATQIAILTKSRRRCCLCYWIDQRKEERPGQIAHLDQDHVNAAEDNLVFLCIEHHDRYDSTTSQSKGYQESEVRHWRNKLYEEYETKQPKPAAEPVVRLSMAQARSIATGEIVSLIIVVFQNLSDRTVFITNFFLDLNDNQRLMLLYDSITGQHPGKQRVEPGDERSIRISRDEIVKCGRPASDYVRAGVQDAVSGVYVTDTEAVQKHVAALLSYKD